MDHHTQNFSQKNSDFRVIAKGRKRKNCTQQANMSKFIEVDVIPKWVESLFKISQKQRSLCIKQVRSNYVEKEFCKDIRNFYRVMFRLRFHRSDKRSDGNNGRMVQVFLNELGVFHYDNEITDEVFTFFYKVHYNQRKPGDIMEMSEFMTKQRAVDNDLLYKM